MLVQCTGLSYSSTHQPGECFVFSQSKMLKFRIDSEFFIYLPYTDENKVKEFETAYEKNEDLSDCIIYERDNWKISVGSGENLGVSFERYNDVEKKYGLVVHFYNPQYVPTDVAMIGCLKAASLDGFILTNKLQTSSKLFSFWVLKEIIDNYSTGQIFSEKSDSFFRSQLTNIIDSSNENIPDEWKKVCGLELPDMRLIKIICYALLIICILFLLIYLFF
jgi:hypothetical protein